MRYGKGSALRLGIGTVGAGGREASGPGDCPLIPEAESVTPGVFRPSKGQSDASLDTTAWLAQGRRSCVSKLLNHFI